MHQNSLEGYSQENLTVAVSREKTCNDWESKERWALIFTAKPLEF
jgi:hypothetical protein